MNKKEIIGLFNNISARYDLSNIIISLGLEIIWRKRFLEHISAGDSIILDACCGSGVSASHISKKAKKADIYGMDFSEEMIGVARGKFSNNPNLSFMVGDVTSLDFEDEIFDSVTIVFGIRNILERKKALKEFYRVTKKGGKLVIMEFNNIRNGIFGHLFRFYLYRIVPPLGGLITGNISAYKYLARTINDFPDPYTFMAIMKDSGWVSVKNLPISGGICNIFTGCRP